MQFRSALALAALLFSSPLLAADAVTERQTLNFNPGWRLFVGDAPDAQQPDFNDTGWKAVTLPRAWNEDDAFGKDIVDHSTGVVWYRKNFVLPAGSEGKKVFIEFEGARQSAELWLNGQRIGAHDNGVMAFGFDLTEWVKPAPAVNVLAVRTNNDWALRELASGSRFQWSDKNFNANYGGLPKNVRLHITDQTYQTLPLYSHLGTTGVYVYANDFDIPGRAATIHVESQVRNETRQPRTFTFRVSVADMDGKVVANFDVGRYTVPGRDQVTAKAEARVKDLHFWSWGYGYLYTVTTSLEADGKPFDVVSTRTGFRKTAFDKGMVTLNDRVIQMHGYAQRTSNEWPAIGLSVPPWLSDFSNGLMVESGANLVRWMHVTPWKQDVESCDRVGLMQMMPAGDSERDPQGRLWAQRVELMRDAIIYNRNNPSILVYEGGNAGISEEHMAELLAVRDQYDPHGGRAIGSRSMLGSPLAEYGGDMLYINKSARHPLWATEYSRDEGQRKYWDEFSPPYHENGDGPLHKGQSARSYNLNQDAHAIENIARWYDYWRERPGTGRRVSSGGVNIVFSDTNTHHRGAENYRRSGEVDAMRIPKDGFYAHQVMWDAWVDPERPRIHILGHWNYAPGVKKNVYVASSADRVELFLNGKSLGAGKQSDRFLFTFENVAWEPGTLKAVGFDAAGKQICETQHETAGEPVALRLKPILSPVGLKADGADLALVEVEVVDAKGRRCPTALNMIDFELTGPAEWRGGIACGPGNYILARSLPVEGGVNRVLVRSTTDAGRITVTAKSSGLTPATIDFTSQPAPTADGFAIAHPADGLPSRLDRGPTPATPSFRPERIDVAVEKVTAADNAGSAPLAFDDNEETTWSGRGPITFALARPARLHEITAKFSGWRTQSYPIRVTVDGKEVYRGVTPRGLGYFTIPLKPVLGQTVKIESIGAGEAREAFSGITEVENQANAATGGENVRAGELSIVEVEFYEPAPEAPRPG